jgi:hypothetical protein
MQLILSRCAARLAAAGGFTSLTLMALISPSPAQSDVIEAILPASPSVLAAIQAAPFSELFSVTTATGEVGYGVKDQDFDPAYDLVGFYSLWADVPEQGLLQAAVMYCILDPDLAGEELVEISLMADDETLVSLTEQVVATNTQDFEVSPQETVTTYADPYYSPYWGASYYGLGGSTFTTSYVPAVDCSLGGARFDLLPVQAAIAQLPTQTLDVALLFSNGQTEMWRLGEGSVAAIKKLPSLQ